jgi:hypothetical protein
MHLAHLADQPRRRVDADVGSEQARLELLDRLVVERALSEPEQIRGEPRAAAVHAGLELREETRAFLRVRFHPQNAPRKSFC